MASSESRKSRKLFTVAEANAMLPLVRAITQDIVSRANALRDRQERIKVKQALMNRGLGGQEISPPAA